MKPTINILIGAPLSGDEARFLRTLHADLSATGALILANFVIDERQIDFVVVTPTCAALLELKNFPRPILGDRNGAWSYIDSAGKRVRHEATNPWRQTLDEKYSLSDAMKNYAKRTAGVPTPTGKNFYTEFEAVVCIYPRIHPDSQVTPGDYRVGVRSYTDILDTLRAGSKARTWTAGDWERFARQDLRLDAATLEEATDSRVLEAATAVHGYRERIRTIVGTGLPPLIEPSADTLYGKRLVQRLLEPNNCFLIGPSGSAKTFHLQHAAVAMASNDGEVPLLVEAARYRGGEFWNLLRQGCAPYFHADPRELLDAIRLNGDRIVLLIDALNECGDAYLPDLLKGVQAFCLRYGARVLFTSQTAVPLAGDIDAEKIALPLPDQAQKRLIYAHHAHIDASLQIDHLCAAFTNTYDLTVAGRCHSVGIAPFSRVALYDRYVQDCLPSDEAVLNALLRALAGLMSETIALALPRDTFLMFAERFLSEQGAPLALIDAVASTRLVRVTSDWFAFEHELLAKYFAAEHLRRRVPPAAWVDEIKRPVNQELLEFLVPRISDRQQLSDLLNATSDVDLLSRACAGHYGTLAQDLVEEEARSLLKAAADDIPNLVARCVSAPADDGRRLLADVAISGNRMWTARDSILCQVVARNLHVPNLQLEFLSLLDLTEWTLRGAVQDAASRDRFRRDPIWGEAVRLYGGILIWGTLAVPCTAILCELRNAMMRSYSAPVDLPIRKQLIQRVDAAPRSDFSLLALLEDRTAAANSDLAEENLNLVRKALESGIYILEVNALEFVQWMNRPVWNARPDLAPVIRKMLDDFEPDNIMTNTVRLEALASYDGLELAITAEDAAAEMRRLIQLNAIDDPQLAEVAALSGHTPGEWLAGLAYGCLTKIFEDIFQGVYCEAYFALTESERANLLCLAAQNPENGYLSDWMLQELLKVGDDHALPIYQRFASQVSVGPTGTMQEAIAAYELGIAGCARWSGTRPRYQGGESAAHRAWDTMGEILFRLYRRRYAGTPESLSDLWASLDGDTLIASGDVLLQILNSGWRLQDDAFEGQHLATRFPHEVRRIVIACLTHEGPLPSIFPYPTHQGGHRPFLIATLGKTGTEVDIPLLREFVEHPEFGRAAILAIEQIRQTGFERTQKVTRQLS